MSRVVSEVSYSELKSSSFDLVLYRPDLSKIPVSEDRYADWLFEESRKMIRLIKSTGSLVVFIKEGASKSRKKTFCLEYLLKMAENDYWTETFVWHKSNPRPTGNKKRLKDGFEYCYQFTRSNDYKFFPDNCLVRAKDEWSTGDDVSCLTRPSNVVDLPSPKGQAPTGLFEFFINLMTERGDSVFLPSVSNGNGCLACLGSGRSYFGVCDDLDLAESKIYDWKSNNIESDKTIFG